MCVRLYARRNFNREIERKTEDRFILFISSALMQHRVLNDRAGLQAKTLGTINYRVIKAGNRDGGTDRGTQYRIR